MISTAASRVGKMETDGPSCPEVGVVGFVPEVWGGLWMPRHQVLTRLAKYYHVAWVEPAQGWRELWLGSGGGQHAAQTAKDENRFLPGFHRFQPSRWYPCLYRPRRLGEWVAARRIRRIVTSLRRQGCHTIVFYIWRPEFDYALDAGFCDASCYHIDDEYSFSPSEVPLNEREIRLIKRVDHVFIHSPALLERKGHINPHTTFVPNGVDYHAFATSKPEPQDLRDIPHPRLGYIGNIKTQLDFRLLLDLAIRRPEWSLVLVGPLGYLGTDVSLVDQLSKLRNVYFLGNKSVETVSAYPQHMDVCLLPYVQNDYTKYIYPLKLHEYLAGGRPVIGTPIRSLEMFKDVIALCRSVEEWESAVRNCLSPAAVLPAAIEHRRSIARSYDWSTLVHTVARTIAERLGGANLSRFNEWCSIPRERA